jgi:festuclavine dehydrogenase
MQLSSSVIMSSSLDPTILLLGGTGKIASRIAPLLSSTSYPSLCASRSGNPPKDTNYPSCRFDWLDTSTYDNPFTHSPNISTIFLIAPQILDVFPPMKAFIDFAITRNVKRFVLVSAFSAPTGGPMMGKVHEYLIQVGVEYAVLRPPWFMGMLPLLYIFQFPCVLSRDDIDGDYLQL